MCKNLKEKIFSSAKDIYKKKLSVEWSKDLENDNKKASQWMYNECMQLSNVLKIPDDLLMLRFSSGLFANPKTFVPICQQWERMSLHVMAPDTLTGEGRVWTLFLHLILCEPILEVSLEPIFQDYQIMVYLMGMGECKLLTYMHEHDMFYDTPLDIKNAENRITCPAFLRFDAKFLPTISGRMTLNFLTSRKCFEHIGYQENSNISYLSSCLRHNLNVIYVTLFNHFRPCVVACMLVSVCWACCARGESHHHAMSESITHLLLFLERTKILVKKNLMDPSVDERDKMVMKKIHKRISKFGSIIHFLQNDCKHVGYSMKALEHLFGLHWELLKK